MSATRKIPKFSPHGWGWGAGSLHARRALKSFPHTGGDGPFILLPAGSHVMFSPRKRGLTEGRRGPRQSYYVFPTAVGMICGNLSGGSNGNGFPHGRGDEPLCVCGSIRLVNVFPTDVGMSLHRPGTYLDFRQFSPHRRGLVLGGNCALILRLGFPHTGGDKTIASHGIQLSRAKRGFARHKNGVTRGLHRFCFLCYPIS